MWDLAPTFNAAVVLAEHRYYGKSQPYGTYDASYEVTEKGRDERSILDCRLPINLPSYHLNKLSLIMLHYCNG